MNALAHAVVAAALFSMLLGLPGCVHGRLDLPPGLPVEDAAAALDAALGLAFGLAGVRAVAVSASCVEETEAYSCTLAADVRIPVRVPPPMLGCPDAPQE